MKLSKNNFLLWRTILFESAILVVFFWLAIASAASAMIGAGSLIYGEHIMFAAPQMRFGSADEQYSGEETNQWIPIPEWLGGTWQALSETVLASYSYLRQQSTISGPVKIAIKRTSIVGAQRDRNGVLWHYVGTPYTRTIVAPDYVEYQKINRVSLLKSDVSELAISCDATVTRVDARTSEFIDKFRETTTTSYTPLAKDLIAVAFVTRDSDMDGTPIFFSRQACTEKRIKPFAIINSDERGDLGASFRAFLVKMGRSDLLPQGN
jgi:hypothetical protein